MQALRFVFSPGGRLAPRAFAVSVIAVYLAGIASHLLTGPDVIVRAGLWAFVAVQVVLVWIWFVLHARRLRDAGRTSGLAVGVAVLYVLSVVVLLIVADGFFNTSDGPMMNPNASSALGLILMLYIIATLLGSIHYDFGWLMVAILLFMACVPVFVTVGFTVWTATRPSVKVG